MRVIAGMLGGRQFKTPHGHRTHPMSDKVRGGLFNVLGELNGLTVLDAFAGSGALSFEAASRGAASVTAIEKDRPAYSLVLQNIRELGLGDKVHASKANVAGWSIHNMEKNFDIVLLDPPYDQLQLNLIQTLVKRHVKSGGLAVLSFPGKVAKPDLDGMEIVADKNYGDSQLIFYRRQD